MARALIVLATLAGLTACGPAPIGGRAQLTLTLPVFEANHVLTVYALAPELKDGTALGCAAVEAQQVDVEDDAEVLAKESASGAAGQAAIELTLDAIPSGENRFFVATVLDNNTAQLWGIGCTGGVTIEVGKEADVSIQVNQI